MPMTDLQTLLSEASAGSRWINYAEERPTEAGVYQWRMPSVSCQGLIITVFAHYRKRGAGYKHVLSPQFDYWDGYRVHVPERLQWRHTDQHQDIRECDTTDPVPEGVELEPCPFCKTVPKWESRQTGSYGRGVVVCGPAHRHNSWSIKCCTWANSPRFDDPRTLAQSRSALLAATEAQEHE